jgi:streptogramin lyase
MRVRCCTVLLRFPMLALAPLVMHPQAAGAALSEPVVVFPIESGNAASSITAGPDGYLWFAEDGVIGRIIPSGVLAGSIHEFSVPSGSLTNSITAGPDGSLWFTEYGVVGRIDVSGRVTEFPVPADSNLSDIAAGPDGNLWFTETDANQIGRITPDGTITEFPIPTEESNPIGITAGPDGKLWFTESIANQIGRINPATGSVDEFPVLTDDALGDNAAPKGIVAGPDGNIWFTEFDADQIGRITPQGSMIEFPIPTKGGSPAGIAVGSDGNLWFTEYVAVLIGRITPGGIIEEFGIPAVEGPLVITGGPDGNLWFTYDGPYIGVLAPLLVTPFQSPTPTSTAPSPTPTAAVPTATPTPTRTPIFAPPRCSGDCNGDGAVAVNEVLTMVNIALGSESISACRAGDGNGDGAIAIGELIAAVQHALGGCPASGSCGDQVIDPGEDCDDGGVCIGGDNAGTACTSESNCVGQGVCIEGVKAEAACDTDSDCPGSHCVHCVPQGGDGCAANCTFETDVPFDFVPGGVVGGQLVTGTSGAFVHDGLVQLALPLRGSETLTIGKERNGRIPVAVKAHTVQFPRISVAILACACVRAVVGKTCGGTLFEADGVTLSKNCTPDYTSGDSVCTGQKPCAFVSGPENAAAGEIGCDGLDPVNVNATQDAGGHFPPPPAPTPPIGSGPEIITLSGTGAPGAALIFNTTAIGTITGQCNQNSIAFGPDGQFCSDDDPQAYRGGIRTLPSVTGSATGEIVNAQSTTPGDTTIGPYSVSGNGFDCGMLTSGMPSASGGGLVVAFTSLNQPMLGDVVVTTQLAGQ